MVSFAILMSSFLTSLYILVISPLSNKVLVKISSHSEDWHFVLFRMSLAIYKLFILRRSHLLIVDLCIDATSVIFRNFSVGEDVE